MQLMTRQQWQTFVLSGTRTGKLAVSRLSGQPHVVPVWFLLDQVEDTDYVVFTMPASSLKAKALRRDPRFGLCVDDDTPPYSFVSIEAEAEITDDLAVMLRWATRLGGRYMGADVAEQFGRRNAVPGELLVHGRITKVVAQAGIAD